MYFDMRKSRSERKRDERIRNKMARGTGLSSSVRSNNERYAYDMHDMHNNVLTTSSDDDLVMYADEEPSFTRKSVDQTMEDILDTKHEINGLMTELSLLSESLCRSHKKVKDILKNYDKNYRRILTENRDYEAANHALQSRVSYLEAKIERYENTQPTYPATTTHTPMNSPSIPYNNGNLIGSDFNLVNGLENQGNPRTNNDSVPITKEGLGEDESILNFSFKNVDDILDIDEYGTMSRDSKYNILRSYINNVKNDLANFNCRHVVRMVSEGYLSEECPRIYNAIGRRCPFFSDVKFRGTSAIIVLLNNRATTNSKVRQHGSSHLRVFSCSLRIKDLVLFVFSSKKRTLDALRTSLSGYIDG